MADDFPLLFSPLRLRRRELPNRLVFPAVGTNYATPDGQVTPSLVEYYARRARGGVGTVVAECASVSAHGRLGRLQLGVWDDSQIPGLRQVADGIRREGAIALLQLTHGGAKVLPHMDEAPVAPSTVRLGARRPRALSREEIRALQRDYLAAAQRALAAGFDGVEVHACHLHLISQFVSPYTNKREDEYGGSVANRARFLLELIRLLRAELGDDFLLFCRINGYELYEGGLQVDEAVATAKLLAGEAIDALSVSALSQFLTFTFEGNTFRYPTSVPAKEAPEGCNTVYAAFIKQGVDTPVVAAGKVLNLGFAERLLSEGKADLVAMARALIADPELPAKARRGEPFNRCIECNACIKMAAVKDLPIGCPVNPEFRRYREFQQRGAEAWLDQASEG